MTEFRNKTEPPTEPGWYWIRLKPETTPYNGAPRPIIPKYISPDILWDVQHIYDWFGPVTEVREG